MRAVVGNLGRGQRSATPQARASQPHQGLEPLDLAGQGFALDQQHLALRRACFRQYRQDP
jgi:hypothetical protein